MKGVNVLAVLRRRSCNAEGSARREAEAVLDAVIDLIDAARVIDERIAYYANLGENAEQNIEDWAYTDNSGDIARYRAALGRVTGAAE